jgi:hypothetical protein
VNPLVFFLYESPPSHPPVRSSIPTWRCHLFIATLVQVANTCSSRILSKYLETNVASDDM